MIDERTVTDSVKFEGNKFINTVFHVNQQMQIYFCDGSVMYYSGVNKEFFNTFITAQSIGKFWHKNIKDKFEQKRIK